MKTYKGFDKDLKCRNFQYEIGKEYEMDGPIEACERGFHACEAPLDVFRYYPPGTSRYCEVEQSGDIDKHGDDSKVASSKIKIGAEVSVPNLIKAHMQYVREKIEHAENKEEKGYSANLAGGYRANLAGGNSANLAGGDSANLAGGDSANLAGGYSAKLAGGDRANLAGGDCANLAGGDCANLAGGDRANAISRGMSSVGENGVACARGNGCKVKGGKGSVLILIEENGGDYNIKDWKAAVVDGRTIKADTWYTLKNGEFVEVAV